MFSAQTKKAFAALAVGVLIAAIGLGTWALVVKGQIPALPTTPEGSIILPPEMIQQFENSTGEPLDKLQKDIKDLQARQQRLQPFYIQLRMNALAAAKVPANQYEQWELDVEKKTLKKIDPKQQGR